MGGPSLRLFATILILSLSGVARADLASDFALCRAEPDSLKRLTCFDNIVVDRNTEKSNTVQNVVSSTAPILLTRVVLRVQQEDHQRSVFSPRVELVPTFKNEAKKTVVAIEHTLTITDAFGDKVIDSVAKLDIKIPPGKTVQSESFYYWEDNQFIPNEPFDRLYGPVNTGVAKATLIVKKAVFADGTTESFK